MSTLRLAAPAAAIIVTVSLNQAVLLLRAPVFITPTKRTRPPVVPTLLALAATRRNRQPRLYNFRCLVVLWTQAQFASKPLPNGSNNDHRANQPKDMTGTQNWAAASFLSAPHTAHQGYPHRVHLKDMRA